MQGCWYRRGAEHTLRGGRRTVGAGGAAIQLARERALKPCTGRFNAGFNNAKDKTPTCLRR